MGAKKIYVLGAIVVLVGIISLKFTYSNDSEHVTKYNNNYETEYEIKITNLQKDSERGHFLTNENGQTYGTYIDKGTGETLEPDLMLVEGNNNFGTITGYVKKTEFYDQQNQPNNPEEAVEYMKKQKEKKCHEKLIPVYTHDGKTVIGEFKIG
ncbi:MAG: hypothetical protein RR745_06405 [Bacilli bacterium]